MYHYQILAQQTAVRPKLDVLEQTFNYKELPTITIKLSDSCANFPCDHTTHFGTNLVPISSNIIVHTYLVLKKSSCVGVIPGTLISQETEMKLLALSINY